MEAITRSPYTPQEPFKEMRTTSASIKEMVESGEWGEAIESIEKLYKEAADLGVKAFSKDPDESSWAVTSDLIDALASPRLERNLSVKRPLAKTIRLYLDIMLWQTLTQETPERTRLRDRLFSKKPKAVGVIREETAEGVRKNLQTVREACPEEEIALRFDLDAALQVVKVLPTVHTELKWEYGQYILGTLLSFSPEGADPEKITEAVPLIRKLHDLKIKGWIAEVLYIQWAGQIACKKPAPIYDDIHQSIEKQKESEAVAFCAIGVYADFVWNAPSPYREMALRELINFTKEHAKSLHTSRWKVRYFALTHLKALKSHPQQKIQERAEAGIAETQATEKHSKLLQLGTSPAPVWNEALHSLQPTTGLTFEHERRAKEEAFFQAYLIKQKVADPGLIALFEENPQHSHLDLSQITGGISPEGFKEALRKSTNLQSLSLKGHPHLTATYLLEVKPPHLKELDLTGHPLTDDLLKQLLEAYPQLDSLTLNGCSKLSGAHLHLFKGHTLSLRETQANNPAPLKQALEGGSLKTLDLSDSTLPLEVLEKGQKLTTLSLAGRALKSTTLTHCSSLIFLNLEKAQEKVADALRQLPSSLTTLNLSSCPGITDAALNTLMAGVPNLENLNLWDAEVTGWEVTGAFPKLRTLQLSYALGKTPISTTNLSQNPLNWANLADKCPLLETLSVEGRLFTPKDLTAIVSKTPNLTHLEATGCPSADEVLIQVLIQTLITRPLEQIKLGEALDELESLDLSNTPFADGHISLLAQCPRLTSLDLSNTPFTDLSALLTACPSLETLNLKGCPSLLSEGLLDLSGLPHLTDSLLQQIMEAFPEATHLDLSGATSLTPNQLIQVITHNRSLTTLNLSGRSLTASVIKALKVTIHIP